MKCMVLSVLLWITASGCSTHQTPPPPPPAAPPPTLSPTPKPGKDGYITTPTGLKYQVLHKGAGTLASAGRLVKVHYTGTLGNAKVFDTSRNRDPFVFTLGRGEVISGWDEGVNGMRIGERRKLIIPSKLAYGATGAAGVIPPNATLFFEIDLLGVN